MRLKNLLSKESVINLLKSLGKLRIKTDHSAIVTFSAMLLILFIAFAIRLFPMRWEIDPKVYEIDWQEYSDYPSQ